MSEPLSRLWLEACSSSCSTHSGTLSNHVYIYLVEMAELRTIVLLQTRLRPIGSHFV